MAGHRLRTTLQEGGSRDVTVGIRPGAMRIGSAGMPAKVELVEDLGDTAILDLDLGGTPIRARVTSGAVPREGDTIQLTARPEDIHVFDAGSGARL
jgi:ABC-type sugar transport system ATPase subunit